MKMGLTAVCLHINGKTISFVVFIAYVSRPHIFIASCYTYLLAHLEQDQPLPRTSPLDPETNQNRIHFRPRFMDMLNAPRSDNHNLPGGEDKKGNFGRLDPIA